MNSYTPTKIAYRISILTRTLIPAIGLLFPIVKLHSETIFSEKFTNTLPSGNMYLSAFGWTGYKDANAANLPVTLAYIPQNLGNPNTEKGYLAFVPSTTGTFAAVKTFSGMDVADCVFAWSMGNTNTTATVRLLVKVGSSWYASSEVFSNTSTYTPTTFASTTTGDVLRSLAFSTAAANWRAFTLTPGSTMSLGATLSNDLASSEITGIGFYVSAPGSAVVRLDSLGITVNGPLFSEEFTNTLTSGDMYLANFGWSGYRDANAANLSAAHAFIPQNLGNPNTKKGYLGVVPGAAGTFAVVKSLSGVDADGCEITWSMGNNLTASTVRLLVKVGANWYASSEVFSNASIYTPTTFATTTTNDVRRLLDFSTAAAKWRSFMLTPGSAMSLGAALGNNLSSSHITGIGFYITTPAGSPVVRLDSLEVTPYFFAGPPLLPPGAAALGYTTCVYDEQPTAADIAPLPGSTGNYKWFRGTCWSNIYPPANRFTTTNGVLTLVRNAEGGGTLVGTPHDFSEGALPTLPGEDGFYIEFDVRLSDNHSDHFPAVWLMPVEHNGGNGQPIGDVYPGDPSGYERWMELDVDEGGFGPGSLATVISWEGIWTPQGYPPPKIYNSYNLANTTSLDRTQVHSFGASYDPIASRVTWWLDGAQYFTADASHVPAIAAIQNFYPILGNQTHGANVPYSMYVSGVRAYVPPAREPLVTAATLGNASNAYTRWQGGRITVGSSDLTVTELGRMMAPGNTGIHTIKLVDAATGQDIPGGSVSIDLTHWRATQFKYGKLTTPVVLQAGQIYYVVSNETAGGNSWYNEQTPVTTTSAVSAIRPVWGNGPGTWNMLDTPGKQFGPMDIKYLVAP